MKIITALITISLVFPAVAIADVYKYRDATGNILLTDTRVKGNHVKLLQVFRFRTTRPPRSGGAKRLAQRKQAVVPFVARVADETKLAPELLHAVILAESAYDPKALSPKGAAGLMQLMPATAKRYGVSDRHDPQQSIRGGARYLRDLLKLFNDDLSLALAAYNAGENAVIKYGHAIPPFPETQHYVRKVTRFFDENRAANKIARN